MKSACCDLIPCLFLLAFPQAWMYKDQMQHLWADREFRSKLMDGILPAGILILTWLVIMLSTWPVRSVFGQPGLMIYTLGLLAVAMLAFYYSIQLQFTHITRAWYGIAGGFLAWNVIEVCAFLGLPAFTNPGGIILILMAAIIFYILWRNILPIGGKFFGAVFIMNWFGHLFIKFQEFFAVGSPVFSLSYHATGYIAVVGVFLTLAYILIHSRRKIERMCAAVLVWFFFSLAIYVFRGGLY